MSLKALVKYTQVNSGMKGSGNFVFYVNDKKIRSVVFDEKHAVQMNLLDFSKDLYKSQAHHTMFIEDLAQLMVLWMKE